MIGALPRCLAKGIIPLGSRFLPRGWGRSYIRVADLQGDGMPRYFFHTEIGQDRVSDPEGVELPDADAAWEKARVTARAVMARDRASQVRLMTACLVVTDEAGEIVLEFPFAEAVTMPPEQDTTLH